MTQGDTTNEPDLTPGAANGRSVQQARRRALARLRLVRMALPLVDGRWAAYRRSIVTAVSYGLLGLAFVLGVIWFFWPENSRWEPAVNSLTLVAGLTGIFVERLTAEAERRTEVLRAVADELRDNTRLLNDERFSPQAPTSRQVYPRLVVSAVDLALVSGALGLHRDAELVGLLHRWRDTVHLFNRRLDLTEISTFSNTVSQADLAAFHRALHRENSYFAATRQMLENLLSRLPPA
ncbi:hypothetical protein EV646_111129 [Kribbella antiqua]|uniref:Uncharacterized protein n=1 Tax=Kribbella antiqua TaxID=2512217 RepID=A0A4R2IHI5_9ACTN|nr:hypothetical protein [Kribbella antiqua]TCO43937.1 hypothetical protein EV646_111129 [Kribbella antiqua]